MTPSNVGQHDLKATITRRGYCFVSLWAAGILLLYVIGGCVGVRALQGHKAETEELRQAWIGSATAEPGAQAPDMRIPPEASPVDVRVGVYLNSIGEFSLRDAGWTADFDIWFRWTGDGSGPGESFQVVNGQIEQRDKEEAYVKGQEQYERYRVKARLTKYFDPSRFPFSDEALTIQVEDGAVGADRLHYVADEQGSGINRLGIPPSLRITKSLMAVKLHSYGSGRGNPRLPVGVEDVHSRFIFALLVSPPGAGVYFKMFQALFASVAIAFLAFFIKPTFVDPRFGLGIGAVFAAVGNNIFVGTLLPQGERIALTNMVNAIGLGTIFLTLVQSTISLHIEDRMGRERLRSLFDKVSSAVFLTGYAVVNLTLPFAARP